MDGKDANNPNLESDQQLLDRWKKGGDTAYEALYRKHLPRIYSIAFRLTGSKEDSEDIAVEVFARGFSSLRGTKDGAKVLPWLIRVAVNLCRDYARRNKVKKSHILDSGELTADAAIDVVADVTNEPSRLVAQSELHQALWKYIRTLPEDQREVIVLNYVLQNSVEEVARALDLPTGTVKSRLARARSFLKMRLENWQSSGDSGQSE